MNISTHFSTGNIHLTTLIFILYACTAFSPLQGQMFSPSDKESNVSFRIRNFGLNVSGTFRGLTGKILFDENNPNKCHFDLNVKTETIDTGISLRDKHLRGEEYFNTTIYPTISFISSHFERVSANSMKVTGMLKMKDVTSKIFIIFTFTQQEDTYLFKGSFNVDRTKYGIGGTSLSLSDLAFVDFSVVANKIDSQ